jgi:hypothetical protein
MMIMRILIPLCIRIITAVFTLSMEQLIIITLVALAVVMLLDISVIAAYMSQERW